MAFERVTLTEVYAALDSGNTAAVCDLLKRLREQQAELLPHLRLDDKGRLTLPIDIRAKYNLRQGCIFELHEVGKNGRARFLLDGIGV